MDVLRSKVCAYCATEKATTRDHPIPKSLFNKPLPVTMITVPACVKCNGSFSKDEEEFKQLISIRVGVGDLKRDALWNRAVRTLKKNKRLARETIHGIQDVELKSPSGLYLGKTRAIKVRVPFIIT